MTFSHITFRIVFITSLYFMSLSFKFSPKRMMGKVCMMSTLSKLHKLPRMYTNSILSVGQSIQFNDEDTHYMKNVIRLGEGDCIRLFNEKNGEYQASLSWTKAKRSIAVQAKILSLIREPSLPLSNSSKPKLSLLFSPIKKDRMKLMVEKATELGLNVFQPVVTQNTNYDLCSDNSLQKTIIQSTEQSEQLSSPLLYPSIHFQDLIKMLQKTSSDRDTNSEIFVNSRLVVCRERGHQQFPHLLTTLQSLDWKTLDWVNILIGPEGGFTAEEFDQVAPYASFVSLGETTLRAETAAISSLSIAHSILDTGNL